MRKVGTLGSCLSGLTAAMLAADYRWHRMNNATIDRSDLFVKYFLRREPMPSRSLIEMLLRLAPDHAHESKNLFDRMFRDTAGLVELPPTTKPLFENLEHERFDALLLDNQYDTHNIKCSYGSVSGRLDFDFNFPVHWCERPEALEGSLRYSPPLDATESARNWAEIARYLRAAQPAAHIVFICSPSSTFENDAGRRARADAFEAPLREALGNADIEVFSQMHIPRELSKLPADTEHFDLPVYRALAGRVFSSLLMARRGGTTDAG
jgi:hypothetical protein